MPWKILPAARKIPILDYGPYFAGEPDALRRLAAEVKDIASSVRSIKSRRTPGANRPRFCGVTLISRAAARGETET
jgi:hypothetical protein